MLKSTPTQPNETAIYKGASSGCWGLVIVIHPKAFPGGKHGTVFPDQTWTLPRGSQTHCLVCTNISTSNWTAHPGSVVLLLYFTNVCVFLPASLGILPCFLATVTDKEFLIKIEISDHPQSSQPPEFQSSGMRRLVLEKNYGFRKQHHGFLHGCDE